LLSTAPENRLGFLSLSTNRRRHALVLVLLNCYFFCHFAHPLWSACSASSCGPWSPASAGSSRWPLSYMIRGKKKRTWVYGPIRPLWFS